MSISTISSRRMSGFTLIELVVVTSTVALMSGVLLDRLFLYQEMAEKVAMQQTVTAIRTSLYLQALNLIAKKKVEAIPELAEQNPMGWLAEKPKNYAGEFVSIGKGNVVSGSWYFNPVDKKLIYLVHNGKNFLSDSEPKQITFGVRVLRGEAETGSGDGVIEGVVLEQLNTFSWFEK